MGQTLKDNLKQLIIDSAINDLYENGVAGASMRRIASDANMTVGNLYRYFKNKDELVNYIIEPVIEKIRNVLLKHTNQSFDLNDYHFDISEMTYDQLLNIFDDIAFELCQLYSQHRRVFIIVLKSHTINNLFLDWVVKIIHNYIRTLFTDGEPDEKQIEHLSRMFAVSLFAGIIDIFLNNDLDVEGIEQVLKTFFRVTLVVANTNFSEWGA